MRKGLRRSEDPSTVRWAGPLRALFICSRRGRRPVDAADAAGDTALMRAARARHPAAAALLRRHGASLDARNQAGQSARALAASVDDPHLNRALGMTP